MTEDNEIENKTPEQILKTDLDSLHSELQEILSNVHGDDEIDNLKKQARVLNKVMLHMLSDADERYDRLIQYGLALRAQNQYRQTVQTVDTLNRRAEKEQQKNKKEQQKLIGNAKKISETPGAKYTDLPHKED